MPCGFSKRAFDVIASILLLLLLMVPAAAIAVAVRCGGPGPILFRQERTGWDGRTFILLKFRSMRLGVDTVRQASPTDERVTPIGAVLRATSLDELPQLVNVLRGEMSLVGPRPHAVAHDAHYAALIPFYGDRYQVRPGMTGLAQVRGLRGGTSKPGSMTRRVEADLEYIAGASWLGDLLILARTIPALISRRNAY